MNDPVVTSPARIRTVTWQDPMPGLKAAAGLSGLDYLREIVDGRLPKPPIAETMGFTAVEVSQGRAVFRGEAGEFLYNPIGVVRGGFAMTLLDSALGCAVHTTLAAGERYTTPETKVNFVRAITSQTGAVRCEATVGRSLGTTLSRRRS